MPLGKLVKRIFNPTCHLKLLFLDSINKPQADLNLSAIVLTEPCVADKET